MFVPAFAATAAAQPEAAAPRVVPCPAACLRCTCGAVPAASAPERAVGVPLTLHLCPLALPASATPRPHTVPLLVRTRTALVRCDTCCAVLSPHAAVARDRRTWTCPFCGTTQPLPHTSSSSTSSSSHEEVPALDPSSPERTHCCVEYMLPAPVVPARRPMAPCFVFVLDVARGAVRSGLLAAAAGALRRWAAHYADNADARVALVLAGRAPALVHLARPPARAALLVVPDPADSTAAALRDPLPVRPETLLVPLAPHRAALVALLRTLDALAEPATPAPALPAALHTALRFARFWGGRIVLFSGGGSGSSTSGSADEESRDDRETYRALALECCQRQISVDAVVVDSGDEKDNDGDSGCASAAHIAALDELAHHTGGSLVSVPRSNSVPRSTSTDDGEDLASATAMRTVLALLCRTTGWESTAYFYASAGATVARVTGNCFVRGRETVATLCADAANTLHAELALARTRPGARVCVQCAFVHTTAGASRRVRVLTACVPVHATVHTVFPTLDAGAVAAAWAAHAAARLAAGDRVHDVREVVVAALVAAMRAYAAAYAGGAAPANSTGVRLPESLALLPLYVLALLKSPLLTEEPVPPATRALWGATARALAPEPLLARLHPRLLDLTPLASEAAPAEAEEEDEGDEGDDKLVGRLVPLALSETSLEAGHVYVLDSGLALDVYAHGACRAELVRALFGADTLARAPLAQLVTRACRPDAMPPACRVLARLVDTAERAALPTPRLRVLPALADIQPRLVGDHTHGYYSYHEFVTMLAR